MVRKDYPGQTIMHLAVLPSRVVYLLFNALTAVFKSARATAANLAHPTM